MYRRTWLSGLGKVVPGSILPGVIAAAMVDPVWSLEGAWLVSPEGDTRDRFLTLAGLRLAQGRISAESTAYGYIDGSAKPVRQWQALVEDDAIRVQFLTPADSRIEVVFRDGEAAILGALTSMRGKRFAVRMTKLPLEELAELREANKPVGRLTGVVVRPASKVVLLYAGASDCPAARIFRTNLSQGVTGQLPRRCGTFAGAAA